MPLTNFIGTLSTVRHTLRWPNLKLWAIITCEIAVTAKIWQFVWEYLRSGLRSRNTVKFLIKMTSLLRTLQYFYFLGPIIKCNSGYGASMGKHSHTCAVTAIAQETVTRWSSLTAWAGTTCTRMIFFFGGVRTRKQSSLAKATAIWIEQSS